MTLSIITLLFSVYSRTVRGWNFPKILKFPSTKMLINYILIIKFHPQNPSLPPSIAVLEHTLLLQWWLFLPLYNIQYICTSFSSALHNSYMTWIALASWKRQREMYSLSILFWCWCYWFLQQISPCIWTMNMPVMHLWQNVQMTSLHC